MHAGFATVWLTALAVIAGVLGTLEPAHASAPRGIDPAALEQLLERAPALGPVHAIVVSRDGVEQAARAFAGPGLDRPANIKSLSKTVQSALVGIAIDQGVLEGPDQPLADLLPERIPEGADPRLRRVTLDHLLSMRAGLAPTSGAHYGRWVQSQDWVGHVLSRPFVAAPGETMQYSTGVWHLVAAILTERSGESLLGLSRRWLAEPLGISIPAWPTDPQGIYFGGNDMMLSPRDLRRFGELYLAGGNGNGNAQVVSAAWIERSWQPRARSPWSGDDYGYGWFVTELAGAQVYYGRGYGGQLLHVVPELGLVVVITSRPTPPSAGGRFVRALHELVATYVIAGARTHDEGSAALPASGGSID